MRAQASYCLSAFSSFYGIISCLQFVSYVRDVLTMQVLHPWIFPNKWQYFENLLGRYYWTLQPKGLHGRGRKESMEAQAFNSYDRKLQFIPVSGLNRPADNRYTIFYKKNIYLGIAIHPGYIVLKLQKPATHQKQA